MFFSNFSDDELRQKLVYFWEYLSEYKEAVNAQFISDVDPAFASGSLSVLSSVQANFLALFYPEGYIFGGDLSEN